MGNVVKKLANERGAFHPRYNEWVIELNYDAKVHIHYKNFRLDMTPDAYNQFFDIMKKSYEKVFGIEDGYSILSI